MSLQRKYFLIAGRHYVMANIGHNYSNEWNQTTVEKIILLMEEIAILESRYANHDTGRLRTAVDVLKDRVTELKGKIHG